MQSKLTVSLDTFSTDYTWRTPIVYRNFWEGNTWTCAAAEFDEDTDDFGDYVVFDMGDVGPRAFRGAWTEVPNHARQVLGTVTLTVDAFDRTPRKAVLRRALESTQQKQV